MFNTISPNNAATPKLTLTYGYPSPGPQTPTSTQVMDNVYFLSSADWKQAQEVNHYDLIIIGTGPCGLAVAHRALHNNPHICILMLERGGFFLPDHIQNFPPAFQGIIGGLYETFPWTLATSTFKGHDGRVTCQHGMAPFFGGRSTIWSAWCPRPTQDEMLGWPQPTIEAARQYFDAAEHFLAVHSADEVEDAQQRKKRTKDELRTIYNVRPVYGSLQMQLQTLLKKGEPRLTTVYRTEPARLASRGVDRNGIDFVKWAVPGPLLQLIEKQKKLEAIGKGARLDLATNCVVERIIQQKGKASALQTSRGVLPIRDGMLVLAMGTLPPTTLVQQSFPTLKNIGTQFSAHFITSIVARVPKKDLDPEDSFCDLEVGSCYIAGVGDNDFSKQYHIQITAWSDRYPEKNAGIARRYTPDILATASMLQLQTSKDYVIFVCAALGELGTMDLSTFVPNGGDDPTTASLLRVVSSDEKSEKTWQVMDECTFQTLENVLSPNGKDRVEYWHGEPDQGEWKKERPGMDARRVTATVHESSTMPIGEDETTNPVNLKYKLVGTEKVYITGGAIWPRAGSWNPTMTMVGLAMHLADILVAKIPEKKDTRTFR